MNTQQVESPQDDDDEQSVVSVGELDNDDKLVLEILKELKGQALTKEEIADRLGWDNAHRVSTTYTNLDDFGFYKVSSRYYDGTRYYYAELDKAKVFFAVMIPVAVLFFAVIMAMEYGLL